MAERFSGGGRVHVGGAPRADAAPRVDAADRARVDAAHASGTFDDPDVLALALACLRADEIDVSIPFPTAQGNAAHLPIKDRSPAYVISLAACVSRDRGSARTDRAAEPDREKAATAVMHADYASAYKGPK